MPAREAIAPTVDEAGIRCPKCGSSERRIEGYFPNKQSAQKVKYRCKSCASVYRVPVIPAEE